MDQDRSKNLVFKFYTAISPKLFKSDKQFIERTKEYNQGFQINFQTAGLRTLRQNFARLASLIAFQHVSTHARE